MNTPTTRGSKDPERTLRTLLGSMSRDAPHPGAKRATLAALGLGTAAATAAGTASALGATGMAAKFVVVAALSGLATTGVVLGVEYGLSPSHPNPAHQATVQPRKAPRSPASPSSPAAVVSAAFDTPKRIETTPVAPVPTPPAKTPSAPPVPDQPEPVLEPDRFLSTTDTPPPPVGPGPSLGAQSSLREETAELDRARSAISAGKARAGLAELDRYDAKYSRGVLAPEAALLRIKALLMTGEELRARALARSFAATHPQSPHLEQLRSLLEP